MEARPKRKAAEAVSELSSRVAKNEASKGGTKRKLSNNNKASGFTGATLNALNQAVSDGANRNTILNQAGKLANKWTTSSKLWTKSDIIKWMARRRENNLTIPTLMNIALQTNLPSNKFNTIYKKISSTRGGSASSLAPYITQNITPANAAQWAAIFSKLNTTMEKFATPSLRTAHSGSEFETIAVATAAQTASIPVLYFPENSNFPSPKSLTYILDIKFDAALKSTGILVLKVRISLDKLKRFETDKDYKKAWFLQFKNNSTNASVKRVGAENYNTPNFPLTRLNGKPANNSNWKGYGDVEPDAIFFKYNPFGILTCHIFEFKIGAGKPEPKPAEAYQLAKAKRSIELMEPFAAKGIIVKNYFFPLKYGQKDPKTNFYNPNKHNNVFSSTFKRSLGANFRVDVIEDPKQFTRVTGIPIQPIYLVLDALRKANLNNIKKRLNHVTRHARPRVGINEETYKKSRMALQASHPQTSTNAKGALASAFRRRNQALVGLPAGANVRAALIRRGPLNAELGADIIRSILVLNSQGYKFVNKHTGQTMSLNNVKNSANLVTGLLSNNPSQVNKYSKRLKAWQERRDAETIRGIWAGLPELKNIEFVAPSPNNATIKTALAKVMANAFKAENLNPVINSLRRVQAPPNIWKSIIKTWANKNATGGRTRTAYSQLLAKGVTPQNAQAIFS
jgi:hypothetical protein